MEGLWIFNPSRYVIWLKDEFVLVFLFFFSDVSFVRMNIIEDHFVTLAAFNNNTNYLDYLQ